MNARQIARLEPERYRSVQPGVPGAAGSARPFRLPPAGNAIRSLVAFLRLTPRQRSMAPEAAAYVALGPRRRGMVRRVARRLPFEAACLPQGDGGAGDAAPASRRQPPRVRRSPRGAQREECLHACPTVDGQPVIGGRNAWAFTPLPVVSPLPAGLARRGAHHEMLGGSRPRNLAPGSLDGAGWLGRALFAHAPRRRSGPSTSGARVDGARRVVCRARRASMLGQFLNHIRGRAGDSRTGRGRGHPNDGGGGECPRLTISPETSGTGRGCQRAGCARVRTGRTDDCRRSRAASRRRRRST